MARFGWEKERKGEGANRGGGKDAGTDIYHNKEHFYTQCEGLNSTNQISRK